MGTSSVLRISLTDAQHPVKKYEVKIRLNAF